VVGVLVEVPVMLSVCHVCVATRHWFDPELSQSELRVEK
jgi:ACR3 family arsenite transporter